ncbi:MAG: formate C-acetyltransferase/glycerol dehydratase family glycyl radical enzyme, partial [bacterium]|nr:formate C-acetyltransferase/glycerol dehydratase family glycyl radical enzyme [bacterium]
MNPRVAELRRRSLEAKPSLSAERALLMTRVTKNAGLTSAPMLRALAFQHLMENMTVCIQPGELIVGERGPAPKATSTFPEICCHTLDDLDILHRRPKIAYAVDEKARKLYEEEIIPFWRDRTMRERILAEMAPEWTAAYEAGVFTEFMEQRAPGHTVMDGKLYRKGFLDFIAEIDRRLGELDDLNDPDAFSKRQQLRAMKACAEAIITFGRRYAAAAGELAAAETDPRRRVELERIAEVCTHVPA